MDSPVTVTGRPRRIGSLLAVVAFIGSAASAQDTPSITGRVTFQSSAPAEMAVVFLGNEAISRYALTDAAGVYHVYGLPPGIYSVIAVGFDVDRAGFFTKKDVSLTDSTPLPLIIDITLTPPD